MDEIYGKRQWMKTTAEMENGGYYVYWDEGNDCIVDTGIFWTDFEEDGVEYVVQYTDPDTGATSEVDNIVAPENYTADEYLQDCRENASDEWNQMLQRGTVRLLEVDE